MDTYAASKARWIAQEESRIAQMKANLKQDQRELSFCESSIVHENKRRNILLGSLERTKTDIERSTKGLEEYKAAL